MALGQWRVSVVLHKLDDLLAKDLGVAFPNFCNDKTCAQSRCRLDRCNIKAQVCQLGKLGAFLNEELLYVVRMSCL